MNSFEIYETTQYLITDTSGLFRFADSKEEAAEIAKDEVCDYDGSSIKIFEIKKVGEAYMPDPTVVVEWDE